MDSFLDIDILYIYICIYISIYLYHCQQYFMVSMMSGMINGCGKTKLPSPASHQ